MTALRLARDGLVVDATARRADTLAELAAAGCTTLALDVTDEESRQAAVRQAEGLETLPIALFRAQLETERLGLLRTCQLVLPGCVIEPGLLPPVRPLP